MKITLTPEEYSDLTIMFLLDCLLNKDEDDFLPTNNERFKEQLEYLESKNVKTQWTKYFIRLDAKYKSKYKHFKKAFNDGFLGSQQIIIQQIPDDPKRLEKVRNKGKASKKDKEGIVKKAVKLATKLITAKTDPNPKKLQQLQEDVVKYMYISGDLDDMQENDDFDLIEENTKEFLEEK